MDTCLATAAALGEFVTVDAVDVVLDWLQLGISSALFEGDCST